MIADKEKVDKKDNEGQTASKLRGSRSRKTTKSAKPRYGTDGVSIRSDASTLTSGGGSDKSTASQNIEFSYRNKCEAVLTLHAKKGELEADKAVLVRENDEKDRKIREIERRMAAMEAGGGGVEVGNTAPAPAPSAFAPKPTETPKTGKASTNNATLHLSEEKRSLRFSNSDETRGSRAKSIPPKELEKSTRLQ